MPKHSFHVSAEIKREALMLEGGLDCRISCFFTTSLCMLGWCLPHTSHHKYPNGNRNANSTVPRAGHIKANEHHSGASVDLTTTHRVSLHCFDTLGSPTRRIPSYLRITQNVLYTTTVACRAIPSWYASFFFSKGSSCGGRHKTCVLRRLVLNERFRNQNSSSPNLWQQHSDVVSSNQWDHPPLASVVITDIP